MKKSISISIIAVFALLILAAFQTDVTPLNVWQWSGNTVNTNTAKIGNKANRSITLITNNTNRLKIDSVGVFRMYPSTQALTISGQKRYDAVLNAFEYYHNSNGSTYTSVWTNSVFATALFQVASTTGQYNSQIVTTNTSGIALSPNGNICFGVSTASVYTNKAMRIGATTAPTSTLSLSGNMNITGNFSTTARVQFNQGADVSSAVGAITVGGDGNVFEITGTSAITLISSTSWQNGSQITLLFTSTASLTDGTANSGANIGFELAGNTNFTGSADDSITLILSEIGGTVRWREKCRSVN